MSAVLGDGNRWEQTLGVADAHAVTPSRYDRDLPPQPQPHSSLAKEDGIGRPLYRWKSFYRLRKGMKEDAERECRSPKLDRPKVVGPT